MTENMLHLLNNIHRLADEKRNDNNWNREIVFSVEGTCNEYFIPQVHICDVRISPPGHTGEEKWLVPLYQYLYHEFILMQGGFGLAPEPYHMVIKNAYNFAVGEIPGGVLKTDGKFQNRDTSNWAPWKQDIGSNEDSVRMLKAASLLRKGIGRDYLVFGRMQKPSDIWGIKIINWQENNRVHNIPAVLHAAWTTQDGRFGIAVANWTGQAQNIAVNDVRLGSSVRVSVATDKIRSFIKESGAAEFELNMPPLCCMIMEKVN